MRYIKFKYYGRRVALKSIVIVFTIYINFTQPSSSQAASSKDVDDMLISTILAESQEWSERLKSVHVSYSISMEDKNVEKYTKKYGTEGNLSENDYNTMLKREVKHDLWLQGTSVRLETKIRGISKSTGQVDWSPFTVTEHKEIAKRNIAGGEITEETTFMIDKIDSKSYARMPTYFDCGVHVNGMLLKDFLRSPKWHVRKASMKETDGQQRILLETQSTKATTWGGKLILKLYLDPDRNFLPVKQEYYTGSGQLIEVLETKYGEVAPNLWLPTSAIDMMYRSSQKNGSGAYRLTRVHRLNTIPKESIIINEDYPESLFDQPIPGSAHVLDRIAGLDYYVGDHPRSIAKPLDALDEGIEELIHQEKGSTESVAGTKTIIPGNDLNSGIKSTNKFKAGRSSTNETISNSIQSSLLKGKWKYILSLAISFICLVTFFLMTKKIIKKQNET